MKILLINPWIRQGGAELITVKTALELKRLGHSVRIVTLFVDTSQMQKEAGGLDYVSLDRVGLWLAKHRFCLYFFGPFLLFALTAKQVSWADILFPHSLPAYAIAGVLGKLSGRKVFWLCNEPPQRRSLSDVSFTDWLMWRLADTKIERWFTKGIDRIIVYSRLMGNEVKLRYNREATVIRLGIDFAFFSKSDPGSVKTLIKKYRLKNKFVLLMVGKLDPQKNQRLSLSVLNELKNKIPKVSLVLVGSGQDERYLKIKSRKLKLNDKVIFAGFANPKLVRAWYQVANLVLFPSQGQTFLAAQSWGFVPFEALCQEKLSIVSSNSGGAEVIEKEKIGLTSLVTVDDFTRAVLDYYKNQKKYRNWAKKGKEWVRKNLSWEKFGREVEKELTS